jgi:hypothetical protein
MINFIADPFLLCRATDVYCYCEYTGPDSARCDDAVRIRIEVGELLGTRVIDYALVGSGGMLSFVERGVV